MANKHCISGQMSGSHQLIHIPNDETTDQCSNPPSLLEQSMQEHTMIVENDGPLTGSNSSSATPAVTPSYQPIPYLSSACTVTELRTSPSCSTPVTLPQSNDTQVAKYQSNNKRTQDNALDSFDISISKHRPHRRQLPYAFRTQHVMSSPFFSSPSPTFFIYKCMHILSIETQTHTCINKHRHKYIHTYTHTHTHIHIHIHIHTLTHTHTHTHTDRTIRDR
ncbi:hypothetical protein LOAG_03333 [Loa loa]|uniref:Uncharacterized protein n=1 Tax=Loa loa TaxID=7209 RepID=A0A1S0U6G1_LOALO|nr:hypothetical protein LOAG_03333 [Loa loa]EFO25149.2 hypothetical protein LOAG_03333 [Loa loa]